MNTNRLDNSSGIGCVCLCTMYKDNVLYLYVWPLQGGSIALLPDKLWMLFCFYNVIFVSCLYYVPSTLYVPSSLKTSICADAPMVRYPYPRDTPFFDATIGLHLYGPTPLYTPIFMFDHGPNSILSPTYPVVDTHLGRSIWYILCCNKWVCRNYFGVRSYTVL